MADVSGVGGGGLSIDSFQKVKRAGIRRDEGCSRLLTKYGPDQSI